MRILISRKSYHSRSIKTGKTLLPGFVYWPQRAAYAIWEGTTEGVFNPRNYRNGWVTLLTITGIVLAISKHGFSHKAASEGVKVHENPYVAYLTWVAMILVVIINATKREAEREGGE